MSIQRILRDTGHGNVNFGKVFAVQLHFRSKFLMIIFVCLLSAPAIADVELSQEKKEKLATTAQKLALCAGVYDMASEFHKATNSPAISINTHETANGAEIAAAFLMASTGIIPDFQYALKYAENTRNSKKIRQAALFEVAGNSPERIDNTVSNLIDSMNKCSILSDLQTDLVQKAKLWIYTNQPKK